jgi:hypothetical protein
LSLSEALGHQYLEAAMFNWFKKKTTPRTDEVPPIFKQFMELMALATALVYAHLTILQIGLIKQNNKG